MRPDTLRGWIHAAPFRPFCLHVTTGVSFAVRHPEQANVYRDRIRLTVGGSGGAGSSRMVDISLLRIVYIEAIPPAPSPSAN